MRQVKDGTSEEAPRLLTVVAAAAYLSTNVKQVRRLIWGRSVPFIKLGKRHLIDWKDLDAWVERTKKVA